MVFVISLTHTSSPPLSPCFFSVCFPPCASHAVVVGEDFDVRCEISLLSALNQPMTCFSTQNLFEKGSRKMRQNVQQKQTNKCAGMFIYSDARLQKKKLFFFTETLGYQNLHRKHFSTLPTPSYLKCRFQLCIRLHVNAGRYWHLKG